MRILVLDGAGAEGCVALVEKREDRLRLVSEARVGGRGGAERSAPMLRDLLGQAGWTVATLDLIAVIVGPGSFTGLRATLALAHGLALGAGCRLQGVMLGEALRRTAGPQALPVWCVTRARRGRIFLDRGTDGPVGCMIDAVPRPRAAPVLLAGDASEAIAALLQGEARPLGLAEADPCAIAGVALDRASGRLPPLVAQPLYVDPPEARPPARGLRPAPA